MRPGIPENHQENRAILSKFDGFLSWFFHIEIHKHGVFHWGVSPVFRQSHRSHVVDVVQTLSKVSFLLYRHHLFVLQGGGVIMGL